MPTNIFITPGVKSEQLVYEDLIIESIKMYGQDVYYLPRSIVSRDDILNEDVASNFDDAYLIEAYIENTEGFEGEGNLLSKFGLEIRDEATFIIARRQWDVLVSRFHDEQLRPMEGDLLYLPLSKSFFELSFVEHEIPFYQLNNLTVYRLQARLFEMSSETFDTGILEVDSVNEQAYTIRVDLNAAAGAFNVGETVTQTISNDPLITVSAKVSGYDDNLLILNLYDIITSDGNYHTFVQTVQGVTGDIIGQDSGATGTVFEVYDKDSVTDETFVNDPMAKNWTFETEADDIIDFTENNPFGEP